MPQPAIQDLHIDALLTMLSIAYMQSAADMIADKIFPIIPVKKQGDKIPKYTKEDWFRDEAKLRAPATETVGGGWTISTDTYFADNYGWHVDIPDENRDNADQPFDPDISATERVTGVLLRRREKSFSADFFKTGVWGTDKAGTTDFTKWGDYALSDPITDIEAGRDGIHTFTGQEANTLVWGRPVWTKIKHHPDFIERIKYTQKGILTVDIVASILEIDRIMVGRAIEVTSKEGASTATFAYIFDDDALLMHVATRPALLTPSAGYTFHWNKMGGLSFIRRLRDDKAMYDRIEGHTFYDQKAIGTDLGYFFSDAV